LVEHVSNRGATTVMTGRLADILDAVESGVTVLDGDLRVVYVNQAAATLCGWSTPEEMLAASANETLGRFELLDESGAPVSPAALPGRRVLAGEDPDPMILGFRVKATGEERWSIVRARAIDGDAGQRLAITTFNDLTAYVQAGQANLAIERRYREIVEALPVFAWLADPEGAIVAANARWLEYTGTMAESVSLDNVEQVHPDERSGLATNWRKAHRAMEPLEATLRLRRHDGEYRWHILRIVPLRGEAGTIQGWIGTATDIDNERRVRDAEQSARRAAEAAAERIERLQGVTRALAGAATRDSVADLVVREGRAALGASGALIAVTSKDRLSIVASDGYDPAATAAYEGMTLASDNPLARAARESEPIWLSDLDAEAPIVDEQTREQLAATPNRSLCAVPLVADGSTFGVLGLSFAEPRSFDQDDRSLIGAYADLCAQALARVALAGIRERLVADLESQRARLEALLQQLPEGLMIAEAPSGRIVLANDRLEEILRVPAGAMHHIAGGEAYQGFDTEGRQLLPEDWPLARAVRGETVPYMEIELLRLDGTRTWIAKRAGPVLDSEGRVVAGVATIIDISEARRARENRQFLSNATELLGSSLDYEETIGRVAELAVPRIADWCAVHVIDESDTPRRIAVAHADPEKLAFAQELQNRYPSDPDSPRGLSLVLRTGQSDMMSEIPADLIEAGAQDPEHLKLLQALQLRSYMCVPIIAGGQILGAMTFVGAESGRVYDAEDLAFAESLASRAASAISNARSFREASRYKSVLDATLDTVFMFDPVTLRMSYVNRGAIDELGYSAEELLSGDATMLIEDLDAIGIRGLVEPLVAGTLDARTETLALCHRDGRSIPVEVLLQHVAPPGEDGRIVAVARDIADRLESQANLRRLAEAEHAKAAELNAVIRAMGDGIFVCGDDGRISLSNPAAEDIFPDVVEETYADVLAQLEEPDEAPELGTVGGPVELRARGAEDRWIEVSTYPVSRSEGEATPHASETIVMLRDVTLNRQRQTIRDTFIGVLSHELRTPVTTIFAGSKVLARDDQLSPETRREIFADIAIESERLHRLVEDVIAMTRFGEDEGEVGTEPVLIQRVLPVVIRSEEIRWPGVTFEMDVPAGMPTAVADPTYVEQVVRNLLSNAAKYGGSGTTVRIEGRADDEEITVTIRDDGPGFPAEEADRLFELFFRSSQTASAAAGAGIGLFVCARLIKAMGGRIWATARPDGGAEFSFTLRIMDEEP
jgi:PAS domain S-box-containing protein